MAHNPIYWQERLTPVGNRITTLGRLAEMAMFNLDRTSEESQKTGQTLLLDAAAEAEQLHTLLKELVEELAR